MVAVFIGIVIFIIKEREKEEEYGDFTMVENYLSHYSGGYSQGILVGIDKGEKRNGYLFIPKDVDYLRRLRKKEKIEIEPQIIYANHWQVEYLPRGTLSGERNIIKIFPPSAEDFPKELRDSEFGIAFLKMLTHKKAEQNVITVMRMEKDIEDKMLRLTKGGDRVSDYLILDKTLTKDMVKKILEGKEMEKKGTSSASLWPPRPGG